MKFLLGALVLSAIVSAPAEAHKRDKHKYHHHHHYDYEETFNPRRHRRLIRRYLKEMDRRSYYNPYYYPPLPLRPPLSPSFVFSF